MGSRTRWCYSWSMTAKSIWLVSQLVLLLLSSRWSSATTSESVFSQFESAEIRNFSSVLIRGHEIFLGAKNYIVRLDGRSFGEISRMELLDQSQADLNYNENYIRIAPVGHESAPGDRFLSCETNAYESTCRLIPFTLEPPRGSDMQQMMISDDGTNDRSYTASATQLLYNNVLVATQPLVRPAVGLNVDIYVGGPYGNSDVGVVRVPFGRSERKIDFPGKNWFAHSASFVAGFEIDGAMYFFVRENADEGRVGASSIAPVYARVVRVCKSDCGTEAYIAGSVAGYRWTAMLKTRLLCSAVSRTAETGYNSDRFTVASAPVEFNYLHHVVFDERNDYFYATFTSFSPDTPQTSVSIDSAVCVFSKQSIVDGFHGQYLVDDGSREGTFSWSVNRSSVATSSCPLAANESCPFIKDIRRVRREANSISHGRRQLLLATTIQPVGEQTLVLAKSTRFNQLASVSFTLNSEKFAVIFILDFELVLHKYLVRSPAVSTYDSQYASPSSSSCLLETFDLALAMGLQRSVQYDTEYKPTAFRIYSVPDRYERWLVATFADRAVRIAASDCARYTNSAECVASRDVLCGWSASQGQCVSVANFQEPGILKTSILLDFAANRSNACPPLQHKPEWSAWSNWETCSQNQDKQRACECRTRSCLPYGVPDLSTWRAASSTPASVSSNETSNSCVGTRIQVRKCVVDGGWSAWSEWTLCPADPVQCETTFRRRTRTCTNPAPEYGGADCSGVSSEQLMCECEQAPQVSYTYGEWTEWQNFSLARLNVPLPQCVSVGKLSYSVALISRTRDCSVEPAIASLPCPNVFDSRLCLSVIGHEAMCNTAIADMEEVSGSNVASLSEWGVWSACLGTCGVGWQTRTRACVVKGDFSSSTTFLELQSQQSRYCDDPLVEWRNCRLAECPSQSNSSVVVVATSWSDWSECRKDESADGEIRQTRNRTRSCVSLEYAEQIPDILSLSGNDLLAYKLPCPGHISTLEVSNCTLQPAVISDNRLLGAGSRIEQQELKVEAVHQVVSNDSFGVMVGTCASGLVIGLTLGLLISILVSRCAHRDSNAICARRTAVALCGMPATMNDVEKVKPDGMTLTADSSYDASRLPPSTVRRAALSVRTDGRTELVLREPPPPVSTARSNETTSSTVRYEPRINVPLPPIPVEERDRMDGPSSRLARVRRGNSENEQFDARTPKQQRSVSKGQPQDNTLAMHSSSTYNTISSGGDPDLQSYRAPTSPLIHTPQNTDVHSRLLINAPLSANSEHEPMFQRSATLRTDLHNGQSLNRGELQAPARFSKLANPTVSRNPISPSSGVASVFASRPSVSDSQYAIPHAVIGNMDNTNSHMPLLSGTLPSAPPGRLLMPSTNATGVNSLANTILSPGIGSVPQVPATLTRQKFRTTRTSSSTTDCEAVDVDEQMRQITRQLLPDGVQGV